MTVTSPEPSSLQSPRRHHSWNITPCSAIWKTRFIMNIIILIIFVIFKFIMHVWNNNYLNSTISISDRRFTNDTGSPLKHQVIPRIALSVSNCPDCIFSSIPDFHQEFSEYWPRDGSRKPRLIVFDRGSPRGKTHDVVHIRMCHYQEREYPEYVFVGQSHAFKMCYLETLVTLRRITVKQYYSGNMLYCVTYT